MALGTSVKAGLGMAKSAIKEAATSEAGRGVIQRAAKSAIIGGAIGGGINVARGESGWEGAKRGAILSGGGSLAKSAYNSHQSGMLKGLLNRGAPSSEAPFVSNGLSSFAGLNKTDLPSAPSSFNDKLVRSPDKLSISDFGKTNDFLSGLGNTSVNFQRNAGSQGVRSAAKSVSGSQKLPPRSKTHSTRKQQLSKDVNSLMKLSQSSKLSGSVLSGRR